MIEMDAATMTAVISAGTALVAVGLTNYFTKKREHEADWRKMKLERYREYILALSANVEERVTPEGQARYSDAVNSLQLVAPPSVLHALEAFIAHTSYRNPDKDINRHDGLLSALMREMRMNLRPSGHDDENLRFRLLGVPRPEAPR
ncbi:hypothetical protein [Geomonas propionica]|uniref:DUF4760 domain-containing protein n=1 Tax=Geomonas propionica TaxID=2798582 RepID=A0ABS0YXU9_9BACT|nr:hypothetical protein [Geomonas propionica]MBJ6802769.1 hypothetical protein [Geomonas propionica]